MLNWYWVEGHEIFRMHLVVRSYRNMLNNNTFELQRKMISITIHTHTHNESLHYNYDDLFSISENGETWVCCCVKWRWYCVDCLPCFFKSFILSCEARYINNNKASSLLYLDGCNSFKLHSRWRNLSNGVTWCYCLLLPFVKEVQAIGVRSMFPDLRILGGKMFILQILYPSCPVHFSSLVSLLSQRRDTILRCNLLFGLIGHLAS